MNEMSRYRFKHELNEGAIISRKNRFIINAKINGKEELCHCPSTGRIGGLILDGTPCLLSESENPERKTGHTVEAISYHHGKGKSMEWVGINQNQVNRYVEFFLRNGQLPKILKPNSEIKREVTFGNSRIDFMIGNDYLELKMPLITLPESKASHGSGSKETKPKKFNSFDRLIKHYSDLAKTVSENSRAMVALCYVYDAPPFQPPPLDEKNIVVQEAVRKATKLGVETWQINMKINKKGVKLLKCFRLDLDFIS
ncbi:DNA/RNA nuclease SfsA [Candidatus Micrarchaeota archaeon]|nr:DNA/RNA nuclease SfsA [Candidatus Micrarchaeota archaeon]MBU1887061.1 DNA/RNA nuclease SfsA [Candidatus Micrarchaeota archaeon]